MKTDRDSPGCQHLNITSRPVRAQVTATRGGGAGQPHATHVSQTGRNAIANQSASVETRAPHQGPEVSAATGRGLGWRAEEEEDREGVPHRVAKLPCWCAGLAGTGGWRSRRCTVRTRGRGGRFCRVVAVRVRPPRPECLCNGADGSIRLLFKSPRGGEGSPTDRWGWGPGWAGGNHPPKPGCLKSFQKIFGACDESHKQVSGGLRRRQGGLATHPPTPPRGSSELEENPGSQSG